MIKNFALNVAHQKMQFSDMIIVIIDQIVHFYGLRLKGRVVELIPWPLPFICIRPILFNLLLLLFL